MGLRSLPIQPGWTVRSPCWMGWGHPLLLVRRRVSLHLCWRLPSADWGSWVNITVAGSFSGDGVFHSPGVWRVTIWPSWGKGALCGACLPFPLHVEEWVLGRGGGETPHPLFAIFPDGGMVETCLHRSLEGGLGLFRPECCLTVVCDPVRLPVEMTRPLSSSVKGVWVSDLSPSFLVGMKSPCGRQPFVW